MVMTFAVRFSTVHVGLVVYASTDAVLGVAISIKGRGSVTDSPSTRWECEVESRAVALDMHGGGNVLILSAGGSSSRGKMPAAQASQGLPLFDLLLSGMYLKLNKSSLQSHWRPLLTACNSSSAGAKGCFHNIPHLACLSVSGLVSLNLGQILLGAKKSNYGR